MSVSDQIIQVLNVLCAKFGIVIDWTSANVIPYLTMLCGKLVTYEIWTSVAWLIFGITMIIISIVILRKPRVKELIEDDYFLAVLTIAGIAVGVALGVGVIICQIGDIIKCVTFPEMYVFEYVQRLINSGS